MTCSWKLRRIRRAHRRDASARPGCPVALVGMGADTVTLDVALVQGRELSVTGVFRYANTYPLALQLISSGAVNVTHVITHRFTLVDTERALTISQIDRRSLSAPSHRTHARRPRCRGIPCPMPQVHDATPVPHQPPVAAAELVSAGRSAGVSGELGGCVRSRVTQASVAQGVATNLRLPKLVWHMQEGDLP